METSAKNGREGSGNRLRPYRRHGQRKSERDHEVRSFSPRERRHYKSRREDSRNSTYYSDDEYSHRHKKKRRRQSLPEENDRNRGARQAEHQDRRSRRRRYRRRRPSSSESSGSLSGPAVNALPRAGIVSDDDDAGIGPNRRRNTAQNSASIDDSVGHFRGRLGAVIGGRYQILREVGLGTFGRVVECLNLDKKKSDRGRRASPGDPYVAIKIVRNVKRYYESALIEARIVQDVNCRGGRGRTHCAVLHDSFTFDGHFCMVFESLGPSLYDFLKRHEYRPFPMVCVQDFAVQLLETVEFLHSFRLIHTDLKIENILLMNDREVTYGHQRVPESTRIKVIDFGGACYDSDKKSSVINTRQYRAPEVILGTGWSMPSDM
jgi:hypothetical protein